MSWANRRRFGKRRAHGPRPNASARVFWRCRRQTVKGGRHVLPSRLRLPRSRGSAGAQPWTATTWTLHSLREGGIAAEVLRERRTVELLAANSRWEYENRPYWRGEVDCCINAWTVANGVWLCADITRIVDCSSSTRCLTVAGTPSGSRARRDRRFIRRSTPCRGCSPMTPRRVGPQRRMTRGAAARDPPAAQALSPSVDQRTSGTVGGPLRLSLPGRVRFEVDAPEGESSKWLTLSAPRVLTW